MKYESYHAISLTFLSKTSEYNSALFCNLNAILNGIIYYVIEVHLSILQKYARNKTIYMVNVIISKHTIIYNKKQLKLLNNIMSYLNVYKTYYLAPT